MTLRTLLPQLLDSVLFPLILALVLALLGLTPWFAGSLFFALSHIFATLYVRHGPIEIGRPARRILGPLFGPIPALVVVIYLFPRSGLQEMSRMVSSYVIYLLYAVAMGFAIPFFQACLGDPVAYDDA